MRFDYYMGDLYPNLAYFSTRSSTIPEAEDKVHLTTEEEVKQVPIQHNPDTSRSILMSVGVIFLLVALLGVRL